MRKLRHAEIGWLILGPVQALSIDFSTAQTFPQLLLFLLPSLFPHAAATPWYLFLGLQSWQRLVGAKSHFGDSRQTYPDHLPPVTQLSPGQIYFFFLNCWSVVDFHYCVRFRFICRAKWSSDKYIYSCCQILFYCRLLQDIEYNSLCSTVGPHWLFYFILFCFVLFCHSCSIQKFLGQESNMSHSSDNAEWRTLIVYIIYSVVYTLILSS